MAKHSNVKLPIILGVVDDSKEIIGSVDEVVFDGIRVRVVDFNEPNEE